MSPFKPGQTFRDCDDCPEMVVVPAGDFMMGSPVTEAGRFDNEGPLRSVRLGQPFAVGKFEVTRGQFRRFIEASGWKPSGGCYFLGKVDATKNWEDPGFTQADEHPVVCVSHEDAQQYVQWLAQRTKLAYRLLTEEEWEYGARAGTTAPRYWGVSQEEACRYENVLDRTHEETYGKEQIFDCEDGYADTAPVGKFKPNAFNLHDMLGNVSEWVVDDCYSERYDETRYCDRRVRVVRGGRWGIGPQVVRSASRSWVGPDFRDVGLGFRVARTLP